MCLIDYASSSASKLGITSLVLDEHFSCLPLIIVVHHISLSDSLSFPLGFLEKFRTWLYHPHYFELDI